jgi:predicted metal-dependent hydrolase
MVRRMARKETARSRINQTLTLPEYTIKENPRARHVYLKLSWHGELEIVVPRGYNRRRTPEVIAAKRIWLERVRARMRRQTQTLPAEYFEQLPTRVCLRALGSTYAVTYRPTADPHIAVVESGKSLIIEGPSNDATACVLGLRVWLKDKARETLTSRLRRTSQELGLPYTKAIIRSQRSRWGSCSVRRVISLNSKLLFLPKKQVYYLFVHELCHTKYLDHSLRYWALVEHKLPDYRCYEAALRNGWRYVPRWVGD